MKDKLLSLQLNFALITFLCFTVKVLITQISFPDSIVLLGMGTLYGYTQYLKRFQPYKLEDAVVRDLTEMKSALSKLNFSQSKQKLKDGNYF